MRLLKRLPILMLAISALAIAGCGSSDEDKIKDVITDVAENSTGKDPDPEKVCGNLSESLLEEETGEEDPDDARKDCEDNVEENADEDEEVKDVEVDDVDVDGDDATADVTITTEEDGDEQEETSTVDLVKEEGDWKLDAEDETQGDSTTGTFETVTGFETDTGFDTGPTTTPGVDSERAEEITSCLTADNHLVITNPGAEVGAEAHLVIDAGTGGVLYVFSSESAASAAEQRVRDEQESAQRDVRVIGDSVIAYMKASEVPDLEKCVTG